MQKKLRDVFLDEPNTTVVDEIMACNKVYDLLLDLSHIKESEKISKKVKANFKLSFHRKFSDKIKSLFSYHKTLKPIEYNHIVKDYYFFLNYFQDKEKRIPYLKSSYDIVLKNDFFSHFKSENIVGICYEASHEVRYIPDKIVSFLIDYFKKRGFEIFIIAIDKEKAENFQKKHNGYPVYKKYSIKELKTILPLLKVFIGTDSGMLHMAGALGLNTIGFFGSNLSTVSGLLTPNFLPIEKQLICRPCGYNNSCQIGKECMEHKKSYLVTLEKPNKGILLKGSIAIRC